MARTGSEDSELVEEVTDRVGDRDGGGCESSISDILDLDGAGVVSRTC